MYIIIIIIYIIFDDFTGLILGLHSANQKCRCKVMLFLIG